MHDLCDAKNLNGTSCRYKPMLGKSKCGVHLSRVDTPEPSICAGHTRAGIPCKYKCKLGLTLCGRHVGLKPKPVKICCLATTKKGVQCTNKCKNMEKRLCKVHIAKNVREGLPPWWFNLKNCLYPVSEHVSCSHYSNKGTCLNYKAHCDGNVYGCSHHTVFLKRVFIEAWRIVQGVVSLITSKRVVSGAQACTFSLYDIMCHKMRYVASQTHINRKGWLKSICGIPKISRLGPLVNSRVVSKCAKNQIQKLIHDIKNFEHLAWRRNRLMFSDRLQEEELTSLFTTYHSLDDCAICCEYDETVPTHHSKCCNQPYHKKCMQKWLSSTIKNHSLFNVSCPTCRKIISRNPKPPNPLYDRCLQYIADIDSCMPNTVFPVHNYISRYQNSYGGYA